MELTPELAVRAALAVVLVVVMQLLARTRYYYVAGMAPLFPTFALISHYIVGTERTAAELRNTVLLGILSLIPYAAYLITVYLLVGRLGLRLSLLAALASWGAAAAILLILWSPG
jgi:membrane protein GlpM